MFGFFKDLFKSQIKVRGGYKEAIDSIKSIKAAEGRNVAPGVTKGEYLKRYGNLMISFYIFFAIDSYLMYGLISPENITGFIVSLAAISLCSSILISYSFISWKFHIIYESWVNEGDYTIINSFSFIDYIRFVSINPLRFFPAPPSNSSKKNY